MTQQAFTTSYTGLARQIFTNAKVLKPKVFEPNEVILFDSDKALWDTGATGTVINLDLANKIGLIPHDITTVSGVGGNSQQNLYLIDVLLPNRLRVENVEVTSGNMKGIDLLIGMNIIALGDFALCQSKGKTTFSFQYPASPKAIDFTKQIENKNSKKSKRKKGRYGKSYFLTISKKLPSLQ